MYALPNNLQILSGYMAFDPDLRNTANSKILQFKVYVSEKIKGRDNQVKTLKHYIECKAWGAIAENVAKNVKKGDYIEVIGKCVVEEWEKDGQKNRKQLCEVAGFKNVSFILNFGKDDNQEDSNNQSFAGGVPDTGFGSDGLPSSFGQPPSFAQEKQDLDDLEGII